MKYLINLLFLVVLTIDCNVKNAQGCDIEDRFDENKYQESRQLVNERVKNPEQASRHYSYILKYSYANGLNPDLIARQIMKESSFKWWVNNGRTNYNNIAVGYMQVMPYWHSGLVYRYMSKKQKDIFNNIPSQVGRQNYLIKMLKIPRINIQVGCAIMGYNKKQQENYPLALIAYYAGPNSKIYKHLKKNEKELLSHHYVTFVIKT